jgi:hypothetical protein
MLLYLELSYKKTVFGIAQGKLYRRSKSLEWLAG